MIIFLLTSIKEARMSTAEVFAHIVRTIVMTGLMAALFIGAFLAMIYLKIPVYWMFAVITCLVVAVVYGTARWHPYWAPMAKRVARIPWDRDDGTKMETLIEMAIVQAGLYTRTETYRISIGECKSRKRTKRRLIGENATYLGAFDSGIWFYIHDRFYARRDGLVCVGLRSGDWRYHQPKSVIEFVDQAGKRPGLIDVIWNGVPKQLDLRNNPPEMEANQRSRP